MVWWYCAILRLRTGEATLLLGKHSWGVTPHEQLVETVWHIGGHSLLYNKGHNFQERFIRGLWNFLWVTRNSWWTPLLDHVENQFSSAQEWRQKSEKITHGRGTVEFSGGLISLHPFSNGMTSFSAPRLIVLKLSTTNHANNPDMLIIIFTKPLQLVFPEWKQTVKVFAAKIAWLLANLF